MPNEEQMTINERRKYLPLIKKRYLKASKLGRGRLLDEMQAITGLHRKSLIRLMSGSLERKPRHKRRGRSYGPEVDDALRVISDSFDHICAERLQPNLVWMATHLASHGEIKVSQPLLAQLRQISLSTVRRILNRLRQDERRLPRKGPAQANRVAREILWGYPLTFWGSAPPVRWGVWITLWTRRRGCGSSAACLDMASGSRGIWPVVLPRRSPARVCRTLCTAPGSRARLRV
jgi:hypothetical protein